MVSQHDLHATADFLEEHAWPDDVIALLREIAEYKGAKLGSIVRIEPPEWFYDSNGWAQGESAITPVGTFWVGEVLDGSFQYNIPDGIEGNRPCDSIEEGKAIVEAWYAERIAACVSFPLHKYNEQEIPF